MKWQSPRPPRCTKKPCEDCTFFSCKKFLFFQEICIGAANVSEMDTFLRLMLRAGPNSICLRESATCMQWEHTTYKVICFISPDQHFFYENIKKINQRVPFLLSKQPHLLCKFSSINNNIIFICCSTKYKIYILYILHKWAWINITYMIQLITGFSQTCLKPPHW